MKFTQTPLQGVMLIEPERHIDGRGYFARTFCEEELRCAGIKFAVRQGSVSFNSAAGTLRGMHFQKAPKAEAKLVRCTSGKIFDAIIDLRKDSPTYCNWYGVELSRENGLTLYIPENFAHGFITLLPNSEVLYLMNEVYDPAYAGGVRWDDPVFSIKWPLKPVTMSEKDALWPGYLP